MATIADLIAQLQTLPPHWQVRATNAGSLEVSELGGRGVIGRRYGFVYPDRVASDKPVIKLMTCRTGWTEEEWAKWQAGANERAKLEAAREAEAKIRWEAGAAERAKQDAERKARWEARAKEQAKKDQDRADWVYKYAVRKIVRPAGKRMP